MRPALPPVPASAWLHTRGGFTFGELVLFCGAQRGFVEQFDRITGSHLASLGSLSPLERMIDDATGFANEECSRFASFVHELVWIRGDWGEFVPLVELRGASEAPQAAPPENPARSS